MGGSTGRGISVCDGDYSGRHVVSEESAASVVRVRYRHDTPAQNFITPPLAPFNWRLQFQKEKILRLTEYLEKMLHVTVI
jgi:hypothetical protein